MKKDYTNLKTAQKRKKMVSEIPGEATKEALSLPKSEFIAKLEARWSMGNFVCVGLDSEFAKLPEQLKNSGKAFGISRFNKGIIAATAPYVCAYKPNLAYYIAEGREGIEALQETVDYIKDVDPQIPVILDAKWGEVRNTNIGYVKFAFDELEVDAVTVNPLLGKEALQPFLDRKDKGIIVLSKTSNQGSGEFQNLQVDDGKYGDTPLFGMIAAHVARDWNENGNVGVVVGATYPEELKRVRITVGDIPILIPGIGAQGGDLEATIKNGQNSRKQGMIINSSRGIIFASNGSDFASAAGREAQTLHDQILFVL